MTQSVLGETIRKNVLSRGLWLNSKSLPCRRFPSSIAKRRILDTVIARIRDAAANGAKLVVFPECMNNGYVWRDRAHSCAGSDKIPGEFTESIGKICKELSVHVAIGMSEKEGEKVYNSAVLIGPNGLIGKYQKNFLFDFDPLYFTFGTTGYPVFDTPLGRIGMFICADARIPEGARVLTMKGAEVLLHITNNTTHEQHEYPRTRSRARE